MKKFATARLVVVLGIIVLAFTFTGIVKATAGPPPAPAPDSSIGVCYEESNDKIYAVIRDLSGVGGFYQLDDDGSVNPGADGALKANKRVLTRIEAKNQSIILN